VGDFQYGNFDRELHLLKINSEIWHRCFIAFREIMQQASRINERTHEQTNQQTRPITTPPGEGKTVYFLIRITSRILTRIDDTADDMVLMTERDYDDVYCKMQCRHFVRSSAATAAESKQ